MEKAKRHFSLEEDLVLIVAPAMILSVARTIWKGTITNGSALLFILAMGLLLWRELLSIASLCSTRKPD